MFERRKLVCNCIKPTLNYSKRERISRTFKVKCTAWLLNTYTPYTFYMPVFCVFFWHTYVAFGCTVLMQTFRTFIHIETTLDMEPFMTPGLMSAQKMELIGIISHQGTGKNGHYVAATKKGTEWILYDDAITTQLTLAQWLQAYVLIYRKTTPNTETGAIPGVWLMLLLLLPKK